MIKLKSSLIIALVCVNCYSQGRLDNDYTGIEYIQLKSEIARGWNTWNTNSILSYVLLPEAISVDFSLKDKISNEVLKEALIGRRGKNAESVLPLSHATDGSYTDLVVSWKNIETRFQSCSAGKEICLLLTPRSENPEGEIQIQPREIWWDREGKTRTGKDKIIYDLPSGKIQLYIRNEQGQLYDTASSYLTYEAGTEIALSTDSTLSPADIRKRIQLAEDEYNSKSLKYGADKDIYHAIQNVLAWDMIYDPCEQRELTTVSRLWNMYRGGYVIFCWDTYFAAYMHSLKIRNLRMANAIEMTNAITPDRALSQI